MTGSKYRRGFVAEDRCLKELIAGGYWAERFHASKGTFDIIAVEKNLTRLIQVKRRKIPIRSVKSVEATYREDLSRMADVPYNLSVCIELWVWVDAQFKTTVSRKRMTEKAGWQKYDLRYDEKKPGGYYLEETEKGVV